MKPSLNGEIAPSFVGVGKSYSSRELLKSKNMSFNVFQELKFSLKFLNLQQFYYQTLGIPAPLLNSRTSFFF